INVAIEKRVIERTKELHLQVLERQKAEVALRDRELLLRSTLESTADGILVVNGDRRATHANKKFQQIWNIPDEVLTQEDALLIREYALKQVKYPDKFLQRLEELCLSNNEVYDVLEFKDGRIIERFSAPLSKNNIAAGRVWSFRDVTSQRKSDQAQQELRDQLERAERLESLGKLAGGVAHDLNNMLGPVVGYSEMLMNELPENSKSAARAAKIKKSAEQAAVVIQDLLTLARRGKYEMRLVSVNDIVKEYSESPAFESLAAKYPGIKIKLDMSKNAGNILGSIPHLSKVIMNLITNAYEAMPPNGKVIIATEKLSAGNGEYMLLKVKDSGHGIAEEDMDKIFEPFYSKKQMGQSGTGLGLSVVYGIVKDHKGLCDVQSQIGKGTVFTLYFPSAMGANAPKEGVQFSVVGGTETILVVDDSLDQRELIHEIVDNLGYFVVTAPDGRFAVDFIKSQEVDLVILDMIMEPGFDGLDTYREMLKVNPLQRAIVVSGYSESDRVQDILNLGAAVFIKKPYNIDTLAGAIRKALDKPAAAVDDSNISQKNRNKGDKKLNEKTASEDSLSAIPGTFDGPFR
ncbi:MAG TPA: ATP-binding protein, partial [candidate division Zixibacteria bacterium]|nr:ATP-binding protein [candidate division Zixibacteria bacterium]